MCIVFVLFICCVCFWLLLVLLFFLSFVFVACVSGCYSYFMCFMCCVCLCVLCVLLFCDVFVVFACVYYLYCSSVLFICCVCLCLFLLFCFFFVFWTLFCVFVGVWFVLLFCLFGVSLLLLTTFVCVCLGVSRLCFVSLSVVFFLSLRVLLYCVLQYTVLPLLKNMFCLCVLCCSFVVSVFSHVLSLIVLCFLCFGHVPCPSFVASLFCFRSSFICVCFWSYSRWWPTIARLVGRTGISAAWSNGSCRFLSAPSFRCRRTMGLEEGQSSHPCVTYRLAPPTAPMGCQTFFRRDE